MEISDNPRDLIHLWKLLVHVMYCIKKLFSHKVPRFSTCNSFHFLLHPIIFSLTGASEVPVKYTNWIHNTAPKYIQDDEGMAYTQNEI